MASRRDQLQSHQFMLGRLAAAFSYGDSDATHPPARRSGSMLFIGVMVGVLALAGVGVYGLIAPGGRKDWKQDGSLIVEKETGARFVYQHDKLIPVLNYSSARLILRKAKISTVTVAAASLSGVPRGGPVGIANAPDAVPARNRLLHSGWSVCSQPGDQGPTSVLLVGSQAQGGQQLGRTAVFVKPVGAPSGPDLYLLWNNTKYSIADADAPVVRAAMTQSERQPVPVAAALTNGIPDGPAIQTVKPGDAGHRSTAGPNLLVGQVITNHSTGNHSEFFVVMDDGVAPISALQAAILLNDPAVTGKAYPDRKPEALPANAVASMHLLPSLVSPDLPQDVPDFVDPSTATRPACALAEPNGQGVRVVYNADPTGNTGIATTASSGQGTTLAQRVVVPPGHGALVRVAPTVVLVTDQGVAYPLANEDVLGYLDYTGKDVTTMPAGLVQLLPRGPALDPDAATKAAAGS